MRHHLAALVCLAFIGSVAAAAPRRHVARHQVEHEEEDVDDEDVAVDDTDADVGDEVADEDVVLETRVRVRTPVTAHAKQWHVAIGPYLWASSVDANVSLGSSTVSTGVDFLEIKRHARYGVEALAEASYGRFAIYGDLLYGVVGIDGARNVGPLMVTLDGAASSLLVDGLGGYRLAGGDDALASLEVRGGVRYQRTAIAGSVNVSGADVSQQGYVDAAADALAGARFTLHPLRRFSLAGTMDLGVFGDSKLTWSATADASVRLTSYVRLSLGWRTLTTARANVSIVMHGPRAALQLMF
jgi:hypothetical protein